MVMEVIDADETQKEISKGYHSVSQAEEAPVSSWVQAHEGRRNLGQRQRSLEE